MLENLNN